jgi:hypothetical protein
MVKPETGSSESGQPLPVTIMYSEEGSQKSLNSELLEAGMARRSVQLGPADLTLGEIEAEARKLKRKFLAVLC